MRPVKFSMVTEDLSNRPAYTALSYTWGDPKIYHLAENEIISQEDWICQCYSVEIDDEEVTVSANLYTALMSIVYVKYATRYAKLKDAIPENLEHIWVDALCINQSDLIKLKQVKLMERILSQSTQTIVWLSGTDFIAETAIVCLATLTDLALAERDKDGTYPRLKLLPEIALDDPPFYDILGTQGHISIRQ